MDAVIEEPSEAVVSAETAERLAANATKMLGAAIVEWDDHLAMVRGALKLTTTDGRAEVLATAAANTLPDTPENLAAARDAVTSFGGLLFALPGEEIDLMTAIRRAAGYVDFEKSVLGRLFWMAVNWVLADDLISLREAADMTQTKMPNISQAGLTFIIDPDSNLRQERRRVLRSEVTQRWAKRIASLANGEAVEE